MSFATLGLVNREEMELVVRKKLNTSMHEYEKYDRQWNWLQKEVISKKMNQIDSTN